MQNFLYKIQLFMQGRNGIDGFGIFLFVSYFFVKSAANFSKSFLLFILSLAIIIFMVFRVLSRNIPKRQYENTIFMKYYNRVLGWFKNSANLSRERARVRPTHKIYVCPRCKKHLKVPKGKGKIEISCPCSYKFTKRT